MAPPPITEITIKAKKKHKRKSHSHETERKEEKKLEAIPEEEEQEETRRLQNATPPPGPTLYATLPFSRTRRNPEELEIYLISLRRKVMDRSEISSLSSRSYFDDSTASFNQTKPQAIFRTRTPPKRKSATKPVEVGTPERPSAAEKDKTPLRRNQGAAVSQDNVASMPAAPPLAMPNVAPSQTNTATPNEAPSLFPFDNISVQTYSTAGSTPGSVLGTMTKRAVQNILDNYLFEDDMDGYSLSAFEKNETDSYFGSIQAYESVEEGESQVKSHADVLVQNTKHEADAKSLQANNNDRNAYLKGSESSSVLMDEYSYSKENERASVLADEYSYFGQEMDVTSLTGSVQADETVALEEKSEIESLPMDAPIKQKEKKKYDRHVNVKSLRVKKNDLKSLRVKKNNEVAQSKENEDTYFEVESLPVNVAVMKKKKHVSDMNVKSLRTTKNIITSLRTKKNDEIAPSKENGSSSPPREDSCNGKEVDVTSLTYSKDNKIVSRKNEESYDGKAVDVTNLPAEKVEMAPSENDMLISSRPDEDSGFENEWLNTSLQKDDEAMTSLSKRGVSPQPGEDLAIDEMALETTEDVITAVRTSLPLHNIDPWWQDADEHHDEEKATKSNMATMSNNVQPMGDPITFRRKFMLIFLILGVAVIAGGIASFVTSRFQAKNDIAATPSPITSEPTNEPTTAPTESPLTPKPTSQPTTRLWAAPTVSNANVDTTSPTSTIAPSASQNLSLRRQIELMSPESVPALGNATSPQTRALEWASQQSNPSLIHFALATLRYATNSTTGWKNEEGWLTSDVCEWFGIVCQDNRVVEISLSFNNLGSTLPDEVSLLTDLQVLSISGSAEKRQKKGNLVGAIPLTWGERLVNLSKLYAQ